MWPKSSSPTPSPRSSRASCCSPRRRRREDYQHRLAGIRAHNRWLVDWCNEYPTQRAGIGQIFLNDLDDAMADARWIKEHGLRGGLLLPNIPPDVHWVKPVYDPYYEPLWSLCEELEIPVHSHGASGAPTTGPIRCPSSSTCQR